MSLNQLYYFVTLAHVEHYTKAAKQLSISQPSLSHAISQLEGELGTFLFEKQGRNVVLTKYGRMFLEYVEESLEILETGIKKTVSMTSEVKGQIDLGYIYTQGSVFVPKIVRGFLDDNQDMDIHFSFCNGVTSNVLKGLKEEQYDVVFCSSQKGERDVDFIPVDKEELVLIVPLNHELAKKKTVCISETAAYPHIAFTIKSGLREVIDDLFEHKKTKQDIAYEVYEDSALAGLVAEGFGIGILPNIPMLKSLNVKILPISDMPYQRYIYMATVKNRYMSPVVKRFVKFVKERYEITI